MAKAYFAGGCFWGVEYHFQNKEGVERTRVGFMGGFIEKPTYEQVSHEETGHAEVVEVQYDPDVVTYEELSKLFFEIHDPTELDRQGPDIGKQYCSVIFYMDDEQRAIAEKLIQILKDKGLDVVTKLEKASSFWEAEEEHQQYYEKNGKEPYCHFYEKRF